MDGASEPPEPVETGSRAHWALPSTEAKIGLGIALVALVYGVISLPQYGVTSDAPALFWAGDLTLHSFMEGDGRAMDFRAEPPADFHSVYDREQANPGDPLYFPVFPALLCAITSAVFHDSLGWLDVIDGHHLALVLLHCLALFFFCIYGWRLLGPVAGVAMTLMIALFPSGLAHSFNNPKDWCCALFYGLAVMAGGLGVMQGKGRHLVAAGLFAGVSLSCKFNGHFVMVTLLIWAPLVYALAFRKRRYVTAKLAAGVFSFPYIYLITFFVLWPWLWHGPLSEWWRNISEHMAFMISRGVGARPTFTDYPFRVLLFMTPPVVLIGALVGLATGWRAWGTHVRGLAGRWRGREQLSIWLLLLIWFAAPIARIAAPRSNFYDANRHFLEYIPALCAIAGLGVATVGGWIHALVGKYPKAALMRGRLPVIAAATAGLLAVGALVYPIAEYRPYEAAYFNSLIGGLGGAQRAGLLHMDAPHVGWVNGTEGDFWWSSVRNAGREYRERDLEGALGICHSGARLWNVNWPQGEPMPPLHEPSDPTPFGEAPYLYLMPRETHCTWRRVRELETRRPIVHRVERGGGLIYEILGPVDGERREPRSAETAYLTL